MTKKFNIAAFGDNDSRWMIFPDNIYSALKIINSQGLYSQTEHMQAARAITEWMLDAARLLSDR